MTEYYPTHLCDKVDQLLKFRHYLTLEWMDYYGVYQHDIVRYTYLTKHALEEYIYKNVYEVWTLHAVENTILNFLRVGPKRYVFHPHKELSYQQVLKMYHIPKDQVVMAWEEPSNKDLCIHLKLD